MAWCFRRWLARVIWLFVLAIATTGVLASNASAVPGIYDVYSCAMPDGRAAPIDGWHVFQRGNGGYVDDRCPRLGLLASFTGDNGFGDQVGWAFDAPPATVVQELTVFRAERSGGAGTGLHVAL